MPPSGQNDVHWKGAVKKWTEDSNLGKIKGDKEGKRGSESASKINDFNISLRAILLTRW